MLRDYNIRIPHAMPCACHCRMGIKDKQTISTPWPSEKKKKNGEVISRDDFGYLFSDVDVRCRSFDAKGWVRNTR